MAQTITLAQLRAEVGYAADVTIGDDRYPAAMVNSWLNQAIQNYQVLRRQAKTSDQKITTVSSSASTTPGADGWPANQTLAMPADFQSLLSVYINANNSGSGKRQLEALTDFDRYSYPWPSSGEPAFYSVLDATSTEPARLKLWPPAGGVYTFEIVYTPEPAILVADADTWEYAPGTLDLVVCDAACKVLDRDGVPEPQQYQTLQTRKAVAEQALKRFSLRDPGVLTMRNTRGISEMSRNRGFFR